ncbi:concanavalin A-like lectin/glucanase domain-containing protein [Podospora conica]|nr:concanavalin A-like lectin/glucanase domain-containing protein [Schizothecium conicum]
MPSLRSTLLAAVAGLAATVYGREILFLPLNETSGTQARDYSGNNNHGRFVNNPQLRGTEGTRLDGVDDHITLPNDLLRNKQHLTVSVEVFVRPEQSGQYFLYGLGNTDAQTGLGMGYVFATDYPQLRAGISRYTWDNESEVRTAAALPRNTWRAVTLVINGNAGTLALFTDGQFISGRTNSKPVPLPSQLGNGATRNNYIGRSLFVKDRYFAGSVRNFRVWDHALSAAEVAAIPRGAQQGGGNQGGGNQGGGNQGGGNSGNQDAAIKRVTTALENLSLPEETSRNLDLPTTSNGLQVTWTSSRTDIVANNGRVTRPRGADVTVVLTARVNTDGVAGERPFYVNIWGQ